MASEAATSTLVREKGRLLAEFRVQLQNEAAKILESVVAASRQELTQRMVKELNQAHEAAAQASYERWNKKIEQDMAIAGQRLVNHGKAVSQHIDGLAAGTMARLHREMDSTRGEAADRFVSRLQERVGPLLEDAQTALQKLAASEDMFREQSEAISMRFQEQAENNVKEILAKACEEQDKRAAAVLEESARNLVKLSQECETSAQNHLRSLIASATDYTISRQYAAQLEGYTRSYLESISKMIAAIPSKAAIQSRD
jgi:Skp family chaperone for outer membrane proteins